MEDWTAACLECFFGISIRLLPQNEIQRYVCVKYESHELVIMTDPTFDRCFVAGCEIPPSFDRACIIRANNNPGELL